MKILFLCTAHNSLSQRLSLDLTAAGHTISIEYGMSDQVMVDAATMFAPDLILCPFLTCRVPKEIYSHWMTLIVHPGPPGDAGPSSLDWLLLGDDGSLENADETLFGLNQPTARPGRSFWGVTILQAIEKFDAGPVWAYDQFPVDIDDPSLTKSILYRGPITRYASKILLVALTRLENAVLDYNLTNASDISIRQSLHLQADPAFGILSVSRYERFKGGPVCHRPLLKAAARDFDPGKHSAAVISRRLRSGDSQPGVQSKIFGPSLYLYGGVIEENVAERNVISIGPAATQVLGIRNEAVCIKTSDNMGAWITNLRRLKGAGQTLWPKIPAVQCLLELRILDASAIDTHQWPLPDPWTVSKSITFQEVWVNFETHDNNKRVAYLHFEFYNGAVSTRQCSLLVDALNYILSKSSEGEPIDAVVLTGGSYFCNGISLTVIEAANDPAAESWFNISRLDDVVHMILHDFPSRGILTIAAMRGNAAAGGVALATACDFVIAGSEVVLNPAYRAIGLSGSEFHTLSYVGRCGKKAAEKILRAMKPMSPLQAQRCGLVDFVFPGTGDTLDRCIQEHIAYLLAPGCLPRGFWKAKVDCSPASLALVRARELSEMGQDFWSARAVRYHTRRSAFVRKMKPVATPTRFAIHRRLPTQTRIDEEEMERFDDSNYYQEKYEDQVLANVQEQLRVKGAVIALDGEVPTSIIPRGLSILPGLASSLPVSAVAEIETEQNVFACYYDPVAAQHTPSDARLGSGIDEIHSG